MKDIFEDMPFKNSREPQEDILSEKEHEELRLLLASARAAFADEDQEILPDPQIHKNLRAMVAARKKIVKWMALPAIDISGILNFKVPAYQVGLAMVMVLFAAIFIGRNTGPNDTKNTVVVYKTDTVFEKMQKKGSTTAISKDSQSEISAPAHAAELYADSIDINNVDNNNTIRPDDAPAGLNSAPRKLNSAPVHSKMQSPGIIDIPEKSGTRIEDSSSRNRQLRG